MNLEIERKFLVDSSSLPVDLNKFKNFLISQGYLAADAGSEIRIRKKGRACFLTVKQGAGLQRKEKEIRLKRQNFDKLWPLTEGRRIEKRRYEIPCGDLCIELDVYLGRLQGLVTAEVEFSSMDEGRGFQPPKWFGPEVTEAEEYKNKNLALHGIPER